MTDSGQPRPFTRLRDDLITGLLGTWFTVGLFLDAWAHSNVPELESFFTPWHAVFYSGFSATAAWIGWLIARNVRAGRRGLAAVPVGYGLTVLALPVFAAAGVGDMLWHVVLGVEQGLTILFSPTHLALAVAMFVILTSPLRAVWAGPLRAPTMGQFLPAALGLAFATSLVMLFALHSNAALWHAPGIVEAFSQPDGVDSGPSPTVLAGAITVTNVVLLAPLLVLARRFVLPVGAATLVYLAVAGLSAATTAFENRSTIVSLVLAGIAVDLLVRWLRPTVERRPAFFGFAMLAPLVTWAIYLAGASLAAGRLPTFTEYWTGAPIVFGLFGLLLALLIAPSLRGTAPRAS